MNSVNVTMIVVFKDMDGGHTDTNYLGEGVRITRENRSG